MSRRPGKKKSLLPEGGVSAILAEHVLPPESPVMPAPHLLAGMHPRVAAVSDDESVDGAVVVQLYLDYRTKRQLRLLAADYVAVQVATGAIGRPSMSGYVRTLVAEAWAQSPRAAEEDKRRTTSGARVTGVVCRQDYNHMVARWIGGDAPSWEEWGVKMKRAGYAVYDDRDRDRDRDQDRIPDEEE